MAAKANKPGRGRPRRVSPEQYAKAILSIRGHEPSIDELCALLDVSKATFYNHIPGHDALVAFSGDVICAAMQLPETRQNMHWSHWCSAFAKTLRQTLIDYPIFVQQMSPRPGQMALLERVIQRLSSLGLDASEALYAFYAISSIEISAAHARQTGELGSSYEDVAPTFSHAIEQTPHTPLLDTLLSEGYSFSSASIFEDILAFTLQGIARQRGETLPEITRT